MAFGLSERFLSPPKSYYLLDPGAYQNTFTPLLRLNKAPFLSKSARGSNTGTRIWTHALYDSDMPSKIPNCTSLMSKVPRFSYEALAKEDIEKILCDCGIENPCECPVEDDKEEIKEENIMCQGKVQRQLFKGPCSKKSPAPSKKDHDFNVLLDGTKIRKLENVKDIFPPFYDTRIIESTAFYQGCKWSKWTSRREQKALEVRPGPADYTIENVPSCEALCAEKVRALKRKTSKQYRFIEMVQRRNVLEGRPGPADYTPNYPKGPQLQWLGSRAERFITGKYDIKPSPTEYCIKRDFDKVEPLQKSCHMKLADPAFFGTKSVRFKPRREEGPSPATYDTCYRQKPLKYCNIAPFGASSERFKKQKIIIEDNDTEDELVESTPKHTYNKCITKELPTWGFKSKTKRFKSLMKKIEEPSPADLPQSNVEVMRSHQLQCNSPFFSSEGRFQPWFNWIPVYGKDKTPGPAYYCLDKPKCLPAVTCGPMCRTRRFPDSAYQTPAPNAYRVDGGIETILNTHNQRLKDNIAMKHEFHWSPRVEPKKLSSHMQETILLNKSIELLEIRDIFEYKKSVSKKSLPKYRYYAYKD
ncbi:uncharacterized protein LOC123880113 [Maniola jurtina]|uniref:uncharacterized protein LOC123880113 n=1 Tax=Maniola jurtina TaxID=191418 RepID=UPI001E68F46E|nr:uncharacterized protein LOC123880113 [Maniola jurtina]